jgi:hypothetical protein
LIEEKFFTAEDGGGLKLEPAFPASSEVKRFKVKSYAKNDSNG